MLFCELMGYIDGNKTSNVQIQHGKVLALMSNTSDLCDSNVCRHGYICLQTSSGRNTSVPIDRKCCEEKFLVNGTHGVNADRVTFSSFYPDHPSTLYYLDSTLGWVAETLNTEQWIQFIEDLRRNQSTSSILYTSIMVLFQSRKIVAGVVTQGRQDAHLQWVKTYEVRYKDRGGAWKYFKDKTGVIMTFPGNSDSNTKKTNYFPRPFSTNGVQLRPKTWHDWITLKFDILGC